MSASPKVSQAPQNTETTPQILSNHAKTPNKPQESMQAPEDPQKDSRAPEDSEMKASPPEAPEDPEDPTRAPEAPQDTPDRNSRAMPPPPENIYQSKQDLYDAAQNWAKNMVTLVLFLTLRSLIRNNVMLILATDLAPAIPQRRQKASSLKQKNLLSFQIH